MPQSSGMVFVVDDDASVREALSSLIRSVGLEVTLYPSADEFLSCRRPEVPSCLVLDVQLPGRSGLDLQRELRDADDEIPIIFITGHGDIPMSVGAMKAGAVEFLPKPFRDEDLLAAIDQALAREAKSRLQRARLKRTRAALDTLTARERQVMNGLLAGKLNKQIAANLGISEVTVKLHRRHVLEKMDVSSLVQLEQAMARVRK